MDERFRLDNQLCFRLYTASRLITQAYHPLLSEYGLTYPQYLVLLVLWEKDGQPVNDIAKRLLLETNTVTPLLKRMEAEGIVERRQSEEDRRVQLLFLTDAGRATEQPEFDLPRRLLADFTDDELQTLDSYLDRMAGKLRGELGDDWQEHEERMRQQRDKFFHGHGGRGHGGGHGHGGRHGHRPHARYDRDVESEACDHNCRTCARSVCVRHQ